MKRCYLDGLLEFAQMLSACWVWLQWRVFHSVTSLRYHHFVTTFDFHCLTHQISWLQGASRLCWSLFVHTAVLARPGSPAGIHHCFWGQLFSHSFWQTMPNIRKGLELDSFDIVLSMQFSVFIHECLLQHLDVICSQRIKMLLIKRSGDVWI